MNNWQKTLLEWCMDVLRVTVSGVLLLDVILACMFSLWFVAHMLWHLRGWCARVLFASDW